MEKNLVIESHEKSCKIGITNIVMEIENILKKSWKSHGISPLFITKHAVAIIPYL